MIRARNVFRSVVAVFALGAGALAWQSGGGAEAPSLPPRPDASVPDAAPRGPGRGPEGFEVATRLVEIAPDARFDSPLAATAIRALAWHWRKMRPPWFRTPSGQAAAWVSSIALRTSASETQWAMPAGGGKAWTPDARIWNMNEGSFDQRESIVAIAPSSATFRVTLPQGARMTFGEGTINATREATVFTVSVVDGGGASHEAYRHRLAPNLARRWSEAACDLSAWAGQNVELRLAVETSPATDEERRPLEHAHEAPSEKPLVDAGAIDAGPPDQLATPGTPVAVWGNPTILGRTQTRVPYNVLW
ncbi:MAG TPA: hypothetical protein VIF62_14465, partial [Labilithrix sp.]